MRTNPESTEDPSLAERLRQAFNYDPETGIVSWKSTGKIWGARWWQRNTLKPGGVRANFKINGVYRTIGVHRAIWLMVKGDIPVSISIDHINGDPFDNRLFNLRLATCSQNIANCADYRGKKEGLPRGVYRRGSKFQACVRKDGKLTYIGTFATANEAHKAYLKKAAELHGEFHRHYTGSDPLRN